MMAYEPQPENEYQETSTELRIATAVFVAVAAWEVAQQMAGLSSMAAWDWIILYRATAIGLFVGGVSYTVVLVAIKLVPGLPALLLEKAEGATGLDLDGKPHRRDLPTGQPKRERTRQQVSVEPLPLVEPEDTAVTAPVAPQWQLRVDEMVYGDRVLINGRLEDLPNGFDTAWLYTVAKERAAGKLETVSTIKLDEVGISRWGNGGSPASLMIELLENTECVQSRGERQPYDWTDAGKRNFPSPTD